MRLYAVRITRTLLVEAQDERMALTIGIDCEREATEHEPDEMDIEELREISMIPPVWRGCYPYGGDGERTVEEMLQDGSEMGASQSAGEEPPLSR